MKRLSLFHKLTSSTTTGNHGIANKKVGFSMLLNYTQKQQLNKSTLLLIEHDEKQIHPTMLNTLQAAKQLSNENLIGLLVTKNPNLVKESSKYFTKIYHINDEYKLSEEYEQCLIEVFNLANKEDPIKHVITTHSVFGKNILPKLASHFNSQPIVDIIQILNNYEFMKPIYAGNAIAQIKFKPQENKPCLLTIRSTAFDKLNELPNKEGQVIQVNLIDTSKIKERITLLNQQLSSTNTTRPDLLQAQRIVSGGRGLKNGDNFKLLYHLADTIGNCAVGATRAAVDDGFVPNDMQVGQTGKVVAPELYIACGVSGAIQHLAGMKDSKVIVAINKDKEAPIFQIADYGIVGDLFEVVPKLTEELKK